MEISNVILPRSGGERMKVTRAAKLGNVYIAEGDVITVKLGYINNDVLLEHGLRPHSSYTGIVTTIRTESITIDASQQYASRIYTIPYSIITGIQLVTADCANAPREEE